MPVPPEFQHIEAFHFVHLDNLESLVPHGLLSCNEQLRRKIAHRSIALAGIQHRRATMAVTAGPGGVVHDYVPFYFCKRSPMLLHVLNAKNVDQQLLAYLCLPITIIEHQACVFTDSSANRNDPPNFFDDPARLDKLNWPEINSLKWKSASETLKQQKMAELLVHARLEFAAIPRIVVWNDSIADIVRKILDDCGCRHPEIGFDSRHYFTKYPSNTLESLVTGPYFIQRDYRDTVKRTLDGINKAKKPTFPKLHALRDALRNNISCVAEMAELEGLFTSNPMHGDHLGEHTRIVVAKLLGLPEFKALGPTDQLLTELGAYFHDVGKGPKARWASKGGKYAVDPDHPLAALPVLERILTQDVGEMKPRSARVLCKLVCYHDLVGDILGRNRDEAQLIDIVDDERELDMLIALAKADVLAVRPDWWDDAAARSLRERVRGKIGTE
jgi:hypothetical protein